MLRSPVPLRVPDAKGVTDTSSRMRGPLRAEAVTGQPSVLMGFLSCPGFPAACNCSSTERFQLFRISWGCKQPKTPLRFNAVS